MRFVFVRLRRAGVSRGLVTVFGRVKAIVKQLFAVFDFSRFHRKGDGFFEGDRGCRGINSLISEVCKIWVNSKVTFYELDGFIVFINI